MVKLEQVMKTLNELEVEKTFSNIFKVQEGFNKRVAFETIKDKKMIKVTYKEYAQLALKKAFIIKRELGNIPNNSYIILKHPNSIEWCVNFWAILLAGFNPVLIDARFSKDDVEYAANQVDAKAILSDDNIEYDLPKINCQIGDGEEYDYDTKNMGKRIVFCTSGSTSRFKMFEYDEIAISSQILNAKEILSKGFGFTQTNKPCNIKNLGFLPFHHIFGFVAVFIWYTSFGAAIVFPEVNSAENLLKTCQKHKVTHIFVVPMFWNYVVKVLKQKLENGTPLEKKYITKAIEEGYKIQSDPTKPNIQKARANAKMVQKLLFGTHVEYMISGGGYIPEETIRIINSIGYPLYNGFGMTEAGITCVELAKDMPTRLKTYIGKPFNSCEFKIEQNGELFIRGTSTYTAQIINGEHLKKPANVWFASGDKAVVEDGNYKIVGRIKELIIGAAGENINPNELELKFENLPFVKYFCIIGVPKAEYDEVSLVLDLTKTLNEAETKELLDAIDKENQTLELYERVINTYVVDETLNLFGINKIPRVKIKNAFINHPENFFNLNKNQKKIIRTIPAELVTLATEVKELVANVLSIDINIIHDDSDFITDLGGDSFYYVSLLLAIEEKYSIKINDDCYKNCTNLYDLVVLINKEKREQTEK